MTYELKSRNRKANAPAPQNVANNNPFKVLADRLTKQVYQKSMSHTWGFGEVGKLVNPHFQMVFVHMQRPRTAPSTTLGDKREDISAFEFCAYLHEMGGQLVGTAIYSGESPSDQRFGEITGLLWTHVSFDRVSQLMAQVIKAGEQFRPNLSTLPPIPHGQHRAPRSTIAR